MERKLAAIFSTDVKGYSRLMGDDEEATIHTLKTYREVITGLIEQHHGRVVDSPGDNMLAEFASAVDAVKAAVAIQAELKTRNNELEVHRQMEFRIGLNVGDVITDEGRLYGDGVNIAARLEGLADPGGICISESVHMQVRNKLALGYDYIGEQEVKNIATPVPVYKVQLESDGTAAPTVSTPQPPRSPGEEKRASRPWLMAALAVVAVLVVGAGGLVWRPFSPQQSPSSDTEPAKQSPLLSLPDKPSIAVLPFTNMSGDPEQEYFSDGMTETLMTDLSKLSGLFVIARNSTFFYKDKTVKTEQIGRELGVRYVLEGSVQRAGARVRINTQLIDATTGGHVWAERYDRELTDIFRLQDEMTQEVVGALRVEVQEAERNRVRRIPTDNLNAYDSLLRGLEYLNRYTSAANAQARQMFERALEQDPEYADAYALLGLSHLIDFWWQWSQDPMKSREHAFALAQRAMGLDDSLSISHRTLGMIYVAQKEHEQALAAVEKAIALDPNDDWAYAQLGEILRFAGRGEEALDLVQQAMRLNPHYPAFYLHFLSNAYWSLGRYEETIAAEKRLLARTPDQLVAYINLAFSYSMLGQEAEARAAAAEVLRLNPAFSLEVARQSWPFKNPADLEQAIAALRKAGLE